MKNESVRCARRVADLLLPRHTVYMTCHNGRSISSRQIDLCAWATIPLLPNVLATPVGRSPHHSTRAVMHAIFWLRANGRKRCECRLPAGVWPISAASNRCLGHPCRHPATTGVVGGTAVWWASAEVGVLSGIFEWQDSSTNLLRFARARVLTMSPL